MACRRPFAARRGPCVTRTFRRSRSAHGGWREGQGAVAGDPSFFSPCARRPHALARCQNSLRLGNILDATSLRSSKVSPKCRTILARRACMRPGGTSWDRLCIKSVAQSKGFLVRAAFLEARTEPITQSRGFSAREAPSSAMAAKARRTGPRTSRGVVRGPGRGAVSEAVSARPRRWRPGAGGRPGARRWREGPRPREARRVRPRSWSRS